MNPSPIEAFTFCGQEFTDLNKLVNAMGAQWQEGKRALFGGRIREHTRRSYPAFAGACLAAEKERQARPGEGSRIFLKWLCKYPGVRALYWQGAVYTGIKKISAALCDRDETAQRVILFLLKHQLLGVFIGNLGGPAALAANIRYIEKAYNRADARVGKSHVLDMITYLMADEKTFTFAGRTFNSPRELAQYLQPIADTSKDALSNAVRPLFPSDTSFDPLFEAWLIRHGFHHELTMWRARFQDGQGGEPDDAGEFLLDEMPDEIPEDDETAGPDFARGLESFEDRFTDMLVRYEETLDNPAAFNGLMNDCFPDFPMQCHLLMALYRMDIIRALREADEITELLTARFQQRLIRDFGTRELYARWAVAVWCRCYGSAVMHKACSVKPVPLI